MPAFFAPLSFLVKESGKGMPLYEENKRPFAYSRCNSRIHAIRGARS
jgi:hypothetical protein